MRSCSQNGGSVRYVKELYCYSFVFGTGFPVKDSVCSFASLIFGLWCRRVFLAGETAFDCVKILHLRPMSGLYNSTEHCLNSRIIIVSFDCRIANRLEFAEKQQ